MQKQVLTWEQFKGYPFAVAEERPEVLVGTARAEKYKAIWNVTENRLAGIVSKEYTVIQHSQVLGEVARAIDTLELKVREVRLLDLREKVFAEILLDREPIAGIVTGLRVGNSMDASVRAFVSAYALRVVCTNGMIGRGIFGRFSRKHIGEFDVSAIGSTIIELISGGEERLKAVIPRAQVEIPLEPKFVLEKLAFGKKYQELVLEQLEKEVQDRKPTWWDLYNAVTYVIDHRKMQEQRRELLHEQASRLLDEEHRTALVEVKG
jgi:hypothetical protein